jgi:hypothetical protein
MYGKAFGMSLCHAWGASPIYLLGKYYLGVRPTAPGYGSYVVEPHLGGLKWIEGTVPTPQGDITLAVNAQQIRVRGVDGSGLLRFASASKPRSASGTIRALGGDRYEMALDGSKEHVVHYLAPREAGAK